MATLVNAQILSTTAATCVQAPPGLAGWWSADSSGADLAGGNEAAVFGGMGFEAGMVGHAFSFSQIGQYAKVTASAQVNVGTAAGFTVETWINPGSLQQSPILEWNVGSGSGGFGVHLYISVPAPSGTGVGSLYANIVDTAGGPHTLTSALGLVQAGQFQHVALTYDKAAGTAVLYLNGAPVASQTLGSFVPQTSYDMYIGYRADGLLAFLGKIDEISLYRRALTGDEIAGIFTAGSGGKCPTLTLGVGAPAIIGQPQPVSVDGGQPAAFSVAAEGDALLVYQWRRNGVVLPGATSSTLNLTGVRSQDAGSYTVVVSNGVGTIISDPATLTVTGAAGCALAPTDLVGWWRGEFNSQDETGNNPASLGGGLGFGPGIVGQAFLFTANGQRVTVPASASLNVGGSDGFTVEAWINPNSGSLAGQRPILEWEVPGQVGVHIYLSVPSPVGGGAGCLFANLVDTSGGSHVLSTAGGVILGDVFQHIALTYNQVAGLATFYLNGSVAAAHAVGAFTPQTAGGLLVGFGKVTGGELTFAGQIDELTLYDRALTAEEIDDIVQADSQGKCELGEPQAPTISEISNLVTDEDVPAVATFQIADPETSAANLELSFTSSDHSLLPPDKISFTRAGNNINATLSPVANRSGIVTITAEVGDPGGLTASESFQLTVNPINDPPSISAIPNQFTAIDSPLEGVAFTISDVDSPVGSLQTEATSDNKTLVPDANLTISGTGPARTLDIEPAAGLSGTSLITVTVSDGAATASSAFQVSVSADPPSVLRVLNATGIRGLEVALPIELVAGGNENAIGFSLTYDPAKLSSPQVTTSVAGAQLNANSSQAGSGRLGVVLALPTGQALAAGTREIIRVSWVISGAAEAGPTPVDFGDQPVVREVADESANGLPAIFQGGVVTVQPGLEGDIAPRPNGSGSVTVLDWVQVGRFAAGLDTPSPLEFQRVDCAPRLSSGQPVLGNGAISVSDWVQAGRYAAGLDPITSAGGPTTLGGLTVGAAVGGTAASVLAISQTIQMGVTTLALGETKPVRIEINSDGTANALGFSVHFDPAALSFAGAVTASGVQGAILNVNASQAANGQVGIALALNAGQSLPIGLTAVAELSFEALVAGPSSMPLIFADQPIVRELVSAAAQLLDASFVDGAVLVGSAETDTDNDGIPDDWESAHGLDPDSADDATLDEDGDGQDNRQEYAAGTDPHNSASRLRVVSLQALEGDIHLSFETVAGKSYDLEVNDQFPQDTWDPVASLTGSGGVMQFTDPSVGAGVRRFYRVICSEGALQAQSGIYGVFEIELTPGPNFISAPLHPLESYRGLASSATAGSLTVAGNPGWQAGQFAPQDGSSQYILLLRKDVSASPSKAGEWWHITGNTDSSVTVDARGGSLDAIVGAGDQVEIRPLTSLKQLFGSGSSLLLNPDADGFASSAQEDLVRFIAGTSFAKEIFYHNGALASAGYYSNGDGPFDGATITLAPDQVMMVDRKSGSATAKLWVLGQVHSLPLAHYLQPGANPIGTGFALPVSLVSSGLMQTPWTSDANGFPSPAEEDLLRTVQGTGFEKEIFHHNGALADPGWYVNGELDNGFFLEPGKGYFLFMKGPAPSIWRATAP